MGTDPHEPRAPRHAALLRWISLERFGLLVAALFLIGGAIAYATTPAAWRPGSDGHYSYLYARSLAFDADIEFGNDYRICGDPFGLGADRGTGHPDNLFYVGPALIWTPVLALLRLLGVAGDGCGVPWTLVCLASTTLAGAAGALFSCSFVASFFPRRTAALAVALTLFGGPALLFAGALPSYGHLYELCFASLFCLACVRHTRAPSLGWSVALALSLGALILQRPSNVAYVLLPLALSSAPGSSRRLHLLGKVAVGALLGVGPLLMINRYLYGSAFTLSHGPYFLSFENSHPFLTLFDAEEGVFLFWPAIWLSLFGLPFLKDANGRLFARGLGGVALALLLVNSATLDWAPVRRFLSLAPFFALGTAGLIARIVDKLGKPSGAYPALAAAALVLPLWAWSLGLTFGASRGLVDLGKPQTQASLYGGGVTGFWALVDRTVGSIPILPAELWAAHRYGIDRHAFKDAAVARWYVRDFRTLEWQDRRIDLEALARQHLIEGVSASPARRAGLKMDSTTARAVFATQWPFVTHVVLRAESRTTTRMRVGFVRGGPTWWSDWQPLSGRKQLVFHVGGANLGSGIQELFIQEERATPSATLLSLELDDRAERRPVVGPRGL